MKWEELSEQQCAIARFLAILGDRWSLLILSDSFLGVRRFETFKTRLGISRTMLSERLKKLSDNGILDKMAYQEKPRRHEYVLTAKGRDLYPVVMTMSQWSNTHYAGEAGAPILFKHEKCQHDFEPQLVCSQCAEPTPPWEVEARTRLDAPGVPNVVRGPLARDLG